MFNGKLWDKIGELEGEIDRLKAKVWRLENPPRYEVGQEIHWRYIEGSTTVSEVKGEIVNVDEGKRYREYTIYEKGCCTRIVYESEIMEDIKSE